MPTNNSFQQLIDHILAEEGGYTAGLADDPGGETNMGISKRSYPNLDIANLTYDQVIEIYRRDYWDAINLGELPAKVALMVLDSAVNQGAGTAVKILQTALGVTVDGVLGPHTTRKAWATASIPLLREIASLRALRYTQAPNFKTWGGPWMRRLFRVYTQALLLGA